MVYAHQVLATQQFQQNPNPLARYRMNQTFQSVQAFIKQAYFDRRLEWADVGQIGLVLLSFKFFQRQQFVVFQQRRLCAKRQDKRHTAGRPGGGNRQTLVKRFEENVPWEHDLKDAKSASRCFSEYLVLGAVGLKTLPIKIVHSQFFTFGLCISHIPTRLAKTLMQMFRLFAGELSVMHGV